MSHAYYGQSGKRVSAAYATKLERKALMCHMAHGSGFVAAKVCRLVAGRVVLGFFFEKKLKLFAIIYCLGILF